MESQDIKLLATKVGVLAKAGEDAKVEEQITRAVRHVEKAYGACKKCYGKGYSTTTQRWIKYGIVACDCSRGMDIETLIEKIENKEEYE